MLSLSINKQATYNLAQSRNLDVRSFDIGCVQFIQFGHSIQHLFTFYAFVFAIRVCFTDCRPPLIERRTRFEYTYMESIMYV